MSTSILLLSLLFLFTSFFSIDGTQLIVANNCKEQIWPAILGNSGHGTLSNGGFSLSPGQQTVLEAPQFWSGRMWGRQGCCFDASGRGSSPCQSGDCSGQLECRGLGGLPPTTVVEMTLGTPGNPTHYYDVSLVDGFNLPVSVVPVGGSAGCGVAACKGDVNACCPEELAVRRGGRVVACKSACLGMGGDRFCCTGRFGTAATCGATAYSKVFKGVCPRAYSYAFDEASGLKSCRANRYVITFCPPN
ncbi:thaumatin-like protein [Salvia hispanica]|uniref:thaumatin-like protein n=1 Tax=Salvia hispanica TaxID=49212 RepID=UPI002009BB29|nr:thaumatin-like protein [Salvia hispanica]